MTDPDKTQIEGRRPRSEPTPNPIEHESFIEDSSSLEGRLAAAAAQKIKDMIAEITTELGFSKVEVLGQGGQAITFRAEKEGRTYTIKAPDILSLDSSTYDREEKVLRGLRHESLCKVYETRVSNGGNVYSIRDYAEGISLKEWTDTKGAVPLDQALAMMRKLLEALRFLHDNRVIHRDVKPSNIILNVMNQNPKEPDLKLIDFGSARQVGNTNTFNCPQSAIFTPLEQRIGCPTYRSDVYSVGVTMVALLTGKLPESSSSTERIHIPSHPSITPFLSHLLTKMTEPDEGKRPTAAEVLRDLSGFELTLGLEVASPLASANKPALFQKQPATKRSTGTAADSEFPLISTYSETLGEDSITAKVINDLMKITQQFQESPVMALADHLKGLPQKAKLSVLQISDLGPLLDNATSSQPFALPHSRNAKSVMNQLLHLARADYGSNRSYRGETPNWLFPVVKEFLGILYAIDENRLRAIREKPLNWQIDHELATCVIEAAFAKTIETIVHEQISARLAVFGSKDTERHTRCVEELNNYLAEVSRKHEKKSNEIGVFCNQYKNHELLYVALEAKAHWAEGTGGDYQTRYYSDAAIVLCLQEEGSDTKTFLSWHVYQHICSESTFDDPKARSQLPERTLARINLLKPSEGYSFFSSKPDEILKQIDLWFEGPLDVSKVKTHTETPILKDIPPERLHDGNPILPTAWQEALFHEEAKTLKIYQTEHIRKLEKEVAESKVEGAALQRNFNFADSLSGEDITTSMMELLQTIDHDNLGLRSIPEGVSVDKAGLITWEIPEGCEFACAGSYQIGRLVKINEVLRLIPPTSEGWTSSVFLNPFRLITEKPSVRKARQELAKDAVASFRVRVSLEKEWGTIYLGKDGALRLVDDTGRILRMPDSASPKIYIRRTYPKPSTHLWWHANR